MRELTEHQWRLAVLLAEGCSNKTMARRLRIRQQTVKNALTVLYRRSGRNRTQIAVWAYTQQHNHGGWVQI